MSRPQCVGSLGAQDSSPGASPHPEQEAAPSTEWRRKGLQMAYTDSQPLCWKQLRAPLVVSLTVAACTGVGCSLQPGSPEALRRQTGAHRLKAEEQQKKHQSSNQQEIVKATKHVWLLQSDKEKSALAGN
jgi:hypothetical protein